MPISAVLMLDLSVSFLAAAVPKIFELPLPLQEDSKVNTHTKIVFIPICAVRFALC